MRALATILGGFLLATALVLTPTHARAWGQFGHLTVCDLAYRNLTDPARKALNALLAGDDGRGVSVPGRDGDELRHYTSFNVGCLEEDERPRKHPKDHFINVARNRPAVAMADCPSDCILSGITRDLGVLKGANNSREDRVFALMSVGHWIGDIHQPLHVSFKDDAGGNGIDVRLTAIGPTGNVIAGKCGTSTYRPAGLHAVWDNCLLEAGLFDHRGKARPAFAVLQRMAGVTPTGGAAKPGKGKGKPAAPGKSKAKGKH